MEYWEDILESLGLDLCPEKISIWCQKSRLIWSISCWGVISLPPPSFSQLTIIWQIWSPRTFDRSGSASTPLFRTCQRRWSAYCSCVGNWRGLRNLTRNLIESKPFGLWVIINFLHIKRHNSSSKSARRQNRSVKGNEVPKTDPSNQQQAKISQFWSN